MKLGFNCHSKTAKMFLRCILATLLLVVLTGCAGSNDGNQTALEQTEIEQEIEQLKNENEKLNRELNAARANSKQASEKIAELEAELAATKEELSALQEDHISQTETISSPSDIVPPQLASGELLIGEWFYQDFNEDGFFSWIQSMTFYANGTGTMNRTYYVPKDEAEEYPFSLENVDVSLGCSWSLNGDDLHIVLETGESADFTFLSDQQQLVLKNGNDKYIREKPALLENYVERCLFAESGVAQAKKDLVHRSFLGTWYFDVLTWTFYDDGAGVIDIPELGGEPATTREFSYSITVDVNETEVTYVCLVIDWPDGSTSYYWPAINNDGSIVLESSAASGTIKLTRIFDTDNCPISTAIIENAMGVFTGSIFSDILPGF